MARPVVPYYKLVDKLGLRGPERVGALGDLLAQNRARGAMPALAGLHADDLSDATVELRPARPNPAHDHPIADALRGWSINQRLLRAPRTAPLTLTTWRNVRLLPHGHTFAIARHGVIDRRSRGLPLKRSGLMAGPAIALPRLAFLEGRHPTDNLAHCLGESLPRLALAIDVAGIPPVACGFARTDAPHTRALVEALCPHVRWLEPGAVYAVDELVMLSTSFTLDGFPFVFADRALAAAAMGPVVRDLPPSRFGRRLYLARTDASRRKMVNETDLIAALALAGFEALEMARLTPFEQLAAVRGADTIVAPHGAALANLVAATSGTRVVELFHPTVGMDTFAVIAITNDLAYTPLFGEAAEAPGAHAPWRIAPHTVLAALGNDSTAASRAGDPGGVNVAQGKVTPGGARGRATPGGAPGGAPPGGAPGPPAPGGAVNTEAAGPQGAAPPEGPPPAAAPDPAACDADGGVATGQRP